MNAPVNPKSNIVNLQIADALAQGATGRSVAEMLGIAPETVSRKKKALKGMIDALAVHYFHQAAPMAVDSTIKAMTLANQVLTDAQQAPTKRPLTEDGKPDMTVETRADILAAHRDLLAVTDKKEARVLVSMGVSPSPNTSVFVNQLNVMNQTVLLPQLQSLFGQSLQVGDSDDVIDVDVRVIEPDAEADVREE